MQMIQFDVEPQQLILGNLQTGMQIVATINMEDLLDKICLDGKDQAALALGLQLIELLPKIDPHKHIDEIIDITKRKTDENT